MYIYWFSSESGLQMPPTTTTTTPHTTVQPLRRHIAKNCLKRQIIFTRYDGRIRLSAGDITRRMTTANGVATRHRYTRPTPNWTTRAGAQVPRRDHRYPSVVQQPPARPHTTISSTSTTTPLKVLRRIPDELRGCAARPV